jgi:uncharacterized membrane protein YkvA (DUF1232 family)
MARLGRRAALAALWKALVSGRSGPSLGKRLAAIPRMIGAILTGRYDGKARLFGMALVSAYIVSPIDLIPEGVLIPLLGPFGLVGLLDDSAAAIWLAGAVLSETERFLAWERERARVIPGTARPGAPDPRRAAESRRAPDPRLGGRKGGSRR